jgi:hypothetical protein
VNRQAEEDGVVALLAAHASARTTIHAPLSGLKRQKRQEEGKENGSRELLEGCKEKFSCDAPQNAPIPVQPHAVAVHHDGLDDVLQKPVLHHLLREVEITVFGAPNEEGGDGTGSKHFSTV